MTRLPHRNFPGIAQHVVQRGNDRQACFADGADFLHYRQERCKAALKHECALHAYVQMNNHVHLLVTPTRPCSLSRTMQAIGRRYVGSLNARYRLTDAVWEGRFKTALVDNNRYLLTCYRYIELNPVRARMVHSPGEYRWSGHACNALGAHEARITPHECYLALGVDAATRQRAYRDLFDQPPPLDQLEELRVYTQQQLALRSDRFRAQIEAPANRSIAVRLRERPRTAEFGSDSDR